MTVFKPSQYIGYIPMQGKHVKYVIKVLYDDHGEKVMTIDSKTNRKYAYRLHEAYGTERYIMLNGKPSFVNTWITANPRNPENPRSL